MYREHSYKVLKRIITTILMTVIALAYFPICLGDTVYADNEELFDRYTPIKSLKFIPHDEGERFNYYYTLLDGSLFHSEYDDNGEPVPGSEYYYYGAHLEVGDKAEVTLQNGEKIVMEYKEIREDEAEWVVGNKEVDNAPRLMTNESDEHRWVPGDNNCKVWLEYVYYDWNQEKDITVKSDIINVQLFENPVKSMEFIPAPNRKTEFTELEIIENGGPSDEGYVYYLEGNFLYGDRLAITWEVGAPETYTYTESAVKYDGEWVDGFVDSNGNSLEEIYDDSPVGGYFELDEKFSFKDSGGKAVYFFYYLQKPIAFEVTVTESDPAEIELYYAKDDAWQELDELYTQLTKNGRGKYRNDQLIELQDIFYNASDAIWGARTIGQVKTVLETAKKALRAVKTNAQITQAEAKEWNGTLNKKIPTVKKPKFKAAKKSIKVSWTKATKKNLKKFDKVEIQVCKDKKFQRTNTKRVEVKKTKKTATVKKLKKGTYYVRVRNVKGSGVNKQVSKWSKVKKLKVK